MSDLLMENVFDRFRAIALTPSRTEKQNILLQNKNNTIFLECLQFLLGNDITTGLSVKKINKVFQLEPSNDTILDVMNYLRKHNTGTDEDIKYVQRYIAGQKENYAEMIEQFVCKELKLGIDAKTVNAVIEDLIKTWEIQQAYPLSEKNEPKDGEWFGLSQKLNGNNCSYYKGKLISRQGKEFTGLQHIIDDIEKLPKYENFFFNGELIRKNIDNLSDGQNFQIGNGVINSDDIDKTCIKFVIYEVLPIKEFENGESKLTYKDRRHNVLNPLSATILELNTDNLEVVPLIYEGTDKSIIRVLLEEANKNGWEGLMLNKDTKWKNKRNNGILKVKSFKHADILCTGVTEGEGKYKGTLGLIKCDYKGYELGVGSGFTDEQRNYYWKHPEEIIGKIVQIKYKGETKNKQCGLSVQFPIFEIVRNDKNEVSYNG